MIVIEKKISKFITEQAFANKDELKDSLWGTLYKIASVTIPLPKTIVLSSKLALTVG